MKEPFDYKISIIIPHKNSIETLSRLFNTIPNNPDIEIIIVDNSNVPILREDINIDRDYSLFWADPKCFAGGARNVGIENAHGKWLIFADADDYFTLNAFETFYKFVDSKAEVVYFGMDGINIETGERSERGDMFTNMVKGYLNGNLNEMFIRTCFPSPCSKMVRLNLVRKYHICFDEVSANNDDYFALLVGYYAESITACDSLVYVYVATIGSIMHRRNPEIMRTRLEVILRCNKFKRKHQLSKCQGSIAYFLVQAMHYDVRTIISFIWLILSYRQNPFVGWKSWFKTYNRLKKNRKKEKQYITQ